MSISVLPENALENARLLLDMAGEKPLYFVLKSNAYGHGLAAIAPLLCREGEKREVKPRFALSSLEEALAFFSLVPRGLSYRPILLLLSPVEDISPLLSHPAFPLVELRPTLYTKKGTLALLSEVETAKRSGLLPPSFRLPCEIKLETGMHRLGFSPSYPLWELFSLPSLRIEGIYSHLGSADEEDLSRTALQCRAFSLALSALRARGISPFCHLSASAAFLRQGFLGMDGGRIGLLLYGVSPISPFSAAYSPLPPTFLPVKRLSGRVLCVGEVKKGESVGYGTRPLKEDARVALLNVGYSDGIPPSAAYEGRATLLSKRLPLIGSVCMEKCFLSVGDLPVKEGDEAIFYGDSPQSTSLFAAECGLSPHALLAFGAKAGV